jgi:hypothetical protein
VPTQSAGPAEKATNSDSLLLPVVQTTPSATFSPEASWDSLFATISVLNIQTVVRILSDDYPRRIWYPAERTPSDPLAGAWDYANDTLRAYTSNDLSFHEYSNQRSLVAIKEGTGNGRAPILFVGTIASRNAPGANYFGGSVAAVLEAARILNPLSLTCDVYFVLVNTLTVGYYGSQSIGSAAVSILLDDLEAQNIIPAALFWFSVMLYENTEDFGAAVLYCVGDLDGTYDNQDLIRDLGQWSSQASGQARILALGQAIDVWEMGGAYEAYLRGIPGISFSQPYGDPWTASGDDTWDVSDWEYDKIREAVGVASCVTAYLGQVGKGEAPSFSGSGTLSPGENMSWFVPLTGNSLVNVTIDWNTNTTLRAEIFTPQGTSVYSRTENDSLIQLSYMVEDPGYHMIFVLNLGNVTISGTITYSHWQDYDQDTLDDWEEFVYGTDSLSADTDRDLLEDPDEITLGTDPNLADTDGDGAWDGIEVLEGSNPLIEDTDNDSLSDGFEISLGMDPTSTDSDDDGISDFDELALGLNPLSNDTDQDGLLDVYEIALGTDATSADTDGDGLNDLFEVLNGLNALNADTDGDGLDDLFEVENGLLPFDVDSDSDGIPDGIDFAPRDHWMNSIPVFGLGGFGFILIIWLFVKRRAYYRSDVL